MRKLLMLFCIVCVQQSFAQVMINFQLPYSGIYSKSQLWNFSVINPEETQVNMRIEILVTDAANGSLVFTGKSGNYLLSQKMVQLNAAILSPITYTVVNSNYNVDINPEGVMPVGKFTVCCVLYFENDIHGGNGDCTEVEVEPIAPPMLVTPADAEVSDVRRPFFSWLPPTPAFSFSNLTYDFKLVTVDALQTPYEALQQNIPLHFESSIGNNTLSFPSSLPDLDTSKLYAWQVSAISNGTATSSEVFTFKVRQYDLDTVSVKAPADYYAPLKKENDATCYVFDNEIKYMYVNETNDSTCYFNIYDISGAAPKTLVQSEALQQIKFGQNFIILNVARYPKIQTKHIYLFELVNANKEKWYMKFDYRKPQN